MKTPSQKYNTSVLRKFLNCVKSLLVFFILHDRRWTKSIDLFKKKCVLFPVCTDIHWYLFMVIRPGNISVSCTKFFPSSIFDLSFRVKYLVLPQFCICLIVCLVIVQKPKLTLEHTYRRNGNRKRFHLIS